MLTNERVIISNALVSQYDLRNVPEYRNTMKNYLHRLRLQIFALHFPRSAGLLHLTRRMTTRKQAMPPSTQRRLLFVDDEENIRLTIPAILQREGFEVSVAASVSEALEMINHQSFDVVLGELQCSWVFFRLVGTCHLSSYRDGPIRHSGSLY